MVMRTHDVAKCRKQKQKRDKNVTFIIKTMCDFMSDNHSDSTIIQRPARIFMNEK